MGRLSRIVVRRFKYDLDHLRARENPGMSSRSLLNIKSIGLFHLIAIPPLWMTSEENLSPGHN